MRNFLIVSVVIMIVALIVGAFFFVGDSSSDTKNSKMMESNSEAIDPGMVADPVSSDSRYVEFDESTLNDTSDTRRVLFFYASWCPTCRPVDLELQNKSGEIPEDVTVIRVNYDDSETDQDEEDLADKYGVTYQHTFVQIDSEGNEITKWNGGGLDELLSNIR